MFKQHREEFLDAIDRVGSSGQLLNGSYTSEFELSIRQRTDRRYAIAVNSCSQALLFTNLYYAAEKYARIMAMPAVSFVATLNAAALSNFDTRYVDVDKHGLMNLDTIEEQMGDSTVINYVNLAGNMVDYNRLKLIITMFKSEQPIIEDAAQSFGAKIGEIPSGKAGTVSVLSFDPMKNLPAFNGGGMILTDDHDLARHALNLRDNGRQDGFTVAGTNSRMSEMDCACMLVKLKYFDQWQERRTQIAHYYTSQLKDIVDTPSAMPNVTHAWSKYIIRSCDRTAIGKWLLDRGIEAKNNYTSPLYRFPHSPSPGSLRHANEFCAENISLPIYPELTDAEVESVADAILDFYT